MRYGIMWGLVLITVGVGAIVWSQSHWENYVDDERDVRSQWPTVRGTVLASSVAWEGDDRHSSPFLKMSFAYQIDGVRYSAKQKLDVHDSFWDRQLGRAPRTEEAKRSYVPGKTVAVYYDPTNYAKAQVVPMAVSSMLAAGMVLEFLAILAGFFAIFGGISFSLNAAYRAE